MQPDDRLEAEGAGGDVLGEHQVADLDRLDGPEAEQGPDRSARGEATMAGAPVDGDRRDLVHRPLAAWLARAVGVSLLVRPPGLQVLPGTDRVRIGDRPAGELAERAGDLAILPIDGRLVIEGLLIFTVDIVPDHPAVFPERAGLDTHERVGLDTHEGRVVGPPEVEGLALHPQGAGESIRSPLHLDRDGCLQGVDQLVEEVAGVAVAQDRQGLLARDGLPLGGQLRGVFPERSG